MTEPHKDPSWALVELLGLSHMKNIMEVDLKLRVGYPPELTVTRALFDTEELRMDSIKGSLVFAPEPKQ